MLITWSTLDKFLFLWHVCSCLFVSARKVWTRLYIRYPLGNCLTSVRQQYLKLFVKCMFILSFRRWYLGIAHSSDGLRLGISACCLLLNGLPILRPRNNKFWKNFKENFLFFLNFSKFLAKSIKIGTDASMKVFRKTDGDLSSDGSQTRTGRPPP